MSIGNLDDVLRDSNSDWDYMDRAIALLSAVETIKSENQRQISPLFNMIDTSSFAVSGYSTSGGGAHTALTIDSTLKAGILLNPAVAFLDSVNCPAESDYYCLIEEHLDHDVPVLIFAGENEYNELVTPDDDIYDSMWALPQYEHVPDDTDKLYFESANEGHSSSVVPSGIVGKHAIFWLNYFMKNDESYCDSIIAQPDGVSSFLTSIVCDQGPPPPSTNIGYLRATEVSYCMDDCDMYHLESENGEFLYSVANQNNIPNFEYFLDRFVEIEGDTISCVECSAVNVNSIFLSNECEQPVSCFVEPCTVANCTSSDDAECYNNYCGGCHADYYYDDEIFTVLMDKIRENPLMAVSTRVENPAVATAILLSKDWIREEVEVIDCWLQNPLRVSEVLRENWSSNDIERLVCACPHHKMLFENKTLNDRVSILAIMEDVHHSLWEKESLQWLLVCLGSTMGRAALSMLDLPWPAILYKKRINSDELRLVHHMPDGPGKDSLLDVLDGLESVENNLPPKRGRTHPMAGWLFQEKIPKPPLKDNHNMEIHIALHRRFQQ